MLEGVKTIGVVGAGTMGAGVAQTFAAAGYPVRLRDIAEAPLGRGMGAIKKSLERTVNIHEAETHLSRLVDAATPAAV